jgi:hypothetical protein
MVWHYRYRCLCGRPATHRIKATHDLWPIRPVITTHTSVCAIHAKGATPRVGWYWTCSVVRVYRFRSIGGAR